MGVTIIVDSTVNMVEAVRSRVQIVPMTLRFGEEEYIDGVTIDSRTFYEKLEKSACLPTTSQATPFQFGEHFSRAVEQGESVVCITCSAHFSGTYQSAVIAAGDFPGKVYVVDSQSVSIGTGILTEYALGLLDRGMGAQEIYEQLLEKRGAVRVLALMDTLEYLKKGGRISKTVAFTGGLLNIKPVVCIENGKIKMLGKARGIRQGNSLLAREIGKTGGMDFEKPVLLGYTGVSDDLLRNFMEENAAIWQEKGDAPPVEIVGSVVGTHLGPGTVAAAFFALEA